MTEKLTGKELVIKVLEDANEPMSCSEIWDIAIKSKYAKIYARGTENDQKKAQINSLLSTWSENENCPIVRYEKGYNGNSAYTYSLNKNIEKNNNKKQNDNIVSQIPKAVRDAVWMRDVGNSKSGKCYICPRIITDDNFEAGHIISKHNGGNDDYDNLRAICIPCNRSMKSTNLEDYKEKHYPNNINKINLNEVTKEDVIRFLEMHKPNDANIKFFDKAIELLKKH